jgi:hypothetical protein
MKTEMRAKVNRREVLFMLLLLDEPSQLLHLNALKLGCGLQVLVSYLHSRSGASSVHLQLTVANEMLVPAVQRPNVYFLLLLHPRLVLWPWTHVADEWV